MSPNHSKVSFLFDCGLRVFHRIVAGFSILPRCKGFFGCCGLRVFHRIVYGVNGKWTKARCLNHFHDLVSGVPDNSQLTIRSCYREIELRGVF